MSKLSDFPLALLLVATPACTRSLFAQSDEEGPPASPSVSSPIAVTTTATLSGSANVAPTDHPQPQNEAKSACNDQRPLDFLVRAHLNTAPKNQAERREQLELRAQSVAYRTKHYGRYESVGRLEDNSQTPKQLSELTRFFGIPIVLNRSIIPALHCVEEHIREQCKATPYQPTILSGIRYKNTYFDGEISNHVYGIAVDVDPSQNPCCHCVKPWSLSRRCSGEKTVWERMDMPKCWVESFERYGFYWLGHDPLEDTMHFEFLGDPDRIVRRELAADALGL